nr:uncharacterized protein LOC109989986 [Labrus bergylta]
MKQVWGDMMGLVHVAVVVLGLFSVGQSAPVTDCESLIQPIEIQGRDQLLGKWTLLAEATNIFGSKYMTKMFVDNAWARLSAANESDTIDTFQYQKMLGHCFMLKSKLTLDGNTLSYVESTEQPFNSSARLLSTGCPDCLVYSAQYFFGESTFSGLQLMSKRTKVSSDELEEFKKQVECLNLPPAAILNKGEGLCPEESTEHIDLTNTMNPEMMSLFYKILESEGGLDILTQLMPVGLESLKEN